MTDATHDSAGLWEIVWLAAPCLNSERIGRLRVAVGTDASAGRLHG